jgi:hypothetical protein
MYLFVFVCISLYFIVFYCHPRQAFKSRNTPGFKLCGSLNSCTSYLYFMLHRIVLYLIVLYCIVFYHIFLYCIVFLLYFIVFYCIVCIIFYSFFILFWCILFYDDNNQQDPHACRRSSTRTHNASGPVPCRNMHHINYSCALRQTTYTKKGWKPSSFYLYEETYRVSIDVWICFLQCIILKMWFGVSWWQELHPHIDYRDVTRSTAGPFRHEFTGHQSIYNGHVHSKTMVAGPGCVLWIYLSALDSHRQSALPLLSETSKKENIE